MRPRRRRRPGVPWSACRSCPSPELLPARGFPVHLRCGSPHRGARRVTTRRRSPPARQAAAGTEWPPPAPRPPAPPTRSPATPRPRPAAPAAGTTPRTGRPAARSARSAPRPARPVARCPRTCCPGRGGGAQLERAARVDHTAADRLADAALHLQRFAGQHRFVQHGRRTGDAPVHGHHLAGADDQQIVDRHLRQRDHAHPDRRGAARTAARARAGPAGHATRGVRPPPRAHAHRPASPRSTRPPGTRRRVACRSATTPQSDPPRRVPVADAASTHTTGGNQRDDVPAIQHASATRRHPTSHAIPPAASAPTVTTTGPARPTVATRRGIRVPQVPNRPCHSLRTRLLQVDHACGAPPQSRTTPKTRS